VNRETLLISEELQTVAAVIDDALANITGKRVGFSLFIWTEDRAQYVSNSTQRQEIQTAVRAVLDGWDQGMPDIPAHEVKG
jgi:hypothetical protein